jgi:hypothetical protein
METDVTKEVQGVAVYAEFSKPNATMMFIITPDGYSEEGHKVNASLYRRIVTSYSPKKQWRNTSLIEVDFSRPLPSGDNFRKQRLAEERLLIVRQLFEGIVTGGWSLVKEPIFVEVSKKDLDDVRKRKTPSKIVYRINQTRKTLGFPVEMTTTPVG